MNISIPLTISVISFFIFLVSLWHLDDYPEAAVWGLSFGIVVSIMALAFTFSIPHGASTTTDTSNFRLEKTPYRVIVTAFDKETVFTDAYTVAKADQVKAVRKSISKNVWGVELDSETTIKLVFAGDLPESK